MEHLNGQDDVVIIFTISPQSSLPFSAHNFCVKSRHVDRPCSCTYWLICAPLTPNVLTATVGQHRFWWGGTYEGAVDCPNYHCGTGWYREEGHSAVVVSGRGLWPQWAEPGIAVLGVLQWRHSGCAIEVFNLLYWNQSTGITNTSSVPHIQRITPGTHVIDQISNCFPNIFPLAPNHLDTFNESNSFMRISETFHLIQMYAYAWTFYVVNSWYICMCMSSSKGGSGICKQ